MNEFIAAVTWVITGMICAAITWFAGDFALAMLSKPFASLSPLELIGGLVAGVVALGAGATTAVCGIFFLSLFYKEAVK